MDSLKIKAFDVYCHKKLIEKKYYGNYYYIYIYIYFFFLKK